MSGNLPVSPHRSARRTLDRRRASGEPPALALLLTFPLLGFNQESPGAATGEVLDVPGTAGEAGLRTMFLALGRYDKHVRVVIPERIVRIAEACHRGFHLGFELVAVARPERADQGERQRPGAGHQFSPFASVRRAATRDH